VENENLIGYIDNLTSFWIIAPKRRSFIITDKRLLIVDSSHVFYCCFCRFRICFRHFRKGLANRITKEEIQENTKKLAQANLDDLLKSNPDNIAIGNANVKVLK